MQIYFIRLDMQALFLILQTERACGSIEPCSHSPSEREKMQDKRDCYERAYRFVKLG